LAPLRSASLLSTLALSMWVKSNRLGSQWKFSCGSSIYRFYSKPVEMSEDIIAEVHLFETEDGGKRWPARNRFGCPININGESFDCRFLLEDGMSISPGATATLKIKFLRPDLVLPLLEIGTVFRLWEGRFIGTAKVLSIAASPSSN
jgi:hypothetical protein